MIFLSDAENRTIESSFAWTKHRNVTDGRTDGQNCCGYYSGNINSAVADMIVQFV